MRVELIPVKPPPCKLGQSVPTNKLSRGSNLLVICYQPDTGIVSMVGSEKMKRFKLGLIALLALTLSGCPDLDSPAIGIVTYDDLLVALWAEFPSSFQTTGPQGLAKVQPAATSSQPNVKAVANVLPGAQRSWTFVGGPDGLNMETYRMVFDIPAGFGFNGFNAAGPVAGTYRLVLNSGITSSAFNVLANGPNNACVDLNPNGICDPFEPFLTHTFTPGAMMRHITNINPDGGDGNPAINARNFQRKAVLTLKVGILDNPVTPGTYIWNVTSTSVDPETGGADNMSGLPPKQFVQTLKINISNGPLISPFTNATGYTAGQSVKLAVEASNQGPTTMADIYVALLKPDNTFWFVTNLNVATGAFTLVPNIAPVFSGIALVQGLNLQAQALVYPIRLAEPKGTYTWFTGFTAPGTLNLIGGFFGETKFAVR